MPRTLAMRDMPAQSVEDMLYASRDMESTKDNLGESLVQSVWSSGAQNISTSIAEVALDSILEEGLLKDIPFFGTAAKGIGVVRTVRDRLFLKKIARFLYGLADVAKDDRDEFRDKMQKDPAFQTRVGENLILLLEHHEHLDKPIILAVAFAAFVRGKIEYRTFLRLGSAIDSAFVEDLRHLPQHYANLEGISLEVGESLYKNGLVKIKHGIGSLDLNEDPAGYTVVEYEVNETGLLLVDLLLENGI